MNAKDFELIEEESRQNENSRFLSGITRSYPSYFTSRSKIWNKPTCNFGTAGKIAQMTRVKSSNVSNQKSQQKVGNFGTYENLWFNAGRSVLSSQLSKNGFNISCDLIFYKKFDNLWRLLHFLCLQLQHNISVDNWIEPLNYIWKHLAYLYLSRLHCSLLLLLNKLGGVSY